MPGSTPSINEQPTKNPAFVVAPVPVLVPSTTTRAPSSTACSTYDVTRSRCSPVTSGPIIVAGSSPGPTTTSEIRVAIASTSVSATDPTATTTEMAMHRSPADPYAAEIAASAAASTSASGSTTMWFFAPPSAWQRLPFDVAVS